MALRLHKAFGVCGYGGFGYKLAFLWPKGASARGVVSYPDKLPRGAKESFLSHVHCTEVAFDNHLIQKFPRLLAQDIHSRMNANPPITALVVRWPWK
jgi:hypothetical protein